MTVARVLVIVSRAHRVRIDKNKSWCFVLTTGSGSDELEVVGLADIIGCLLDEEERRAVEEFEGVAMVRGKGESNLSEAASIYAPTKPTGQIER